MDQADEGWLAMPCSPLQVTDGAAACVLMTRAEADKRGLKPLGRLLSFTAVSHASVMGGADE